MAVLCTKCGEALLGAVNRCWKCGSVFTPSRGEAELPPVRRSTIDLDLVVANFNSNSTPAETTASDPSVDSPNSRDEVRRGSPFAHAQVGEASVSRPAFNPSVNEAAFPTPARYPLHTSSIGGAISGVVLGIFSVIAIFISSVGAMITSILGIGLGLWGLYSSQRGLAIVGLVLCFIIFAIAGFFCAVALYEAMYGYSPFDRILPEGEDVQTSSDSGNLSLQQPESETIRWHAFG